MMTAKHRSTLIRLAAVLVIAGVALAAPLLPSALPDRPARTAMAMGDLPLTFVPNAGRLDPAVAFVVHGWSGGALFFTPEEIVLSLPSTPADSSTPNDLGGQTPPTRSGLPDPPLAWTEPDSVVRLRFDGANPDVQVAPANRLAGTVNYFLGDDPSAWRARVPTYGGVVYRGLYPGIDLRYDGGAGVLKGTYEVAPGADPALVRWHYEGARDPRVDEGGALHIRLPEDGAPTNPRALVEDAPVAWQMVGGRHVPVEVGFRVQPDGTVGFAVGDYDPRRPLVIDPTVIFATYLGGGAREHGFSLDLDAAGNIYVAGGTASRDFPVHVPLQPARGAVSAYYLADAFITKLTPDGQTVLFSTYLGGDTNGETAESITVDARGDCYITGETLSTDFPMKDPFQAAYGGGERDGFIAKVSGDGSQLLYATYLGGADWEEPQDVTVDGAGNVFVTGWTSSDDYPLVNPLQSNHGGGRDAFLLKLRATDHQPLFSTYLGGADSDHGWGVAVDAAGRPHIAGSTSSTDFPTANALQATIGTAPTRTLESDAFLTKLQPDGSGLVYSTYLGGIGEDRAIGIVIDGAGDAVVTGMSGYPGDFPLVNPIQSRFVGRSRDAIMLKMRADGGAMAYSTFLGEDGDDWGVDIDLDAAGNSYVVGRTTSANFPLKEPVQGTWAGANDTFVAAMPPDGSQLIYSTFVGGSDHDMGLGMAVDPAGSAHVTGWTGSPDYPVVNPLQAAPGGAQEVFIVKIGEPDPPAQPTPTDPPAPSTPIADCVCDLVQQRVPASVVSHAVANPDQYRGWLERLDPGKPASPANPVRTCLSLMHINLDYDREYNPPVWRVGCP